MWLSLSHTDHPELVRVMGADHRLSAVTLEDGSSDVDLSEWECRGTVLGLEQIVKFTGIRQSGPRMPERDAPVAWTVQR